MKTPVANRNARRFVQSRRLFAGNNTDSELIGDAYVVRSHRVVPLFVHIGDQWFSLADDCNVGAIIAKHIAQLHPLAPTIALTHGQMRDLVRDLYDHGSLVALSRLLPCA